MKRFVDMESNLRTEPETVDAEALRRLLDGRHRLVREHTRAILARDEFAKPAEPLPTTEEYREPWSASWTAAARRHAAARRCCSRRSSAASAGSARRSPGFETLALSDLSLLVKCGVQFGLFGGAVHHLGTRSAPRALPLADRLASSCPARSR